MSVRGRIALFKRWAGIISGNNRVAIEQGEGKYYSKDKIEGYYNDLTGKVNDKTLLDSNGIPINIIEGNKKVYFPISIFQYALGLWDLNLSEYNDDRQNHFIRLCNWIIENQDDNGSWNCFEPIGYSKYTVSSMGQGEAISVLLRAYKLSNDEKYINASKRAMEFMVKEIKEGGTLLIDGNNHYLEEYPSEDGEKLTVLNGWIFSLFGMYDYLTVSDDEKIRDIFNKNIDTMKRHLVDYDLGYWSLYDRSGRIASPAYHKLHIALLMSLSDLTGEMYFKQVALKWQQYSQNKSKRLYAIAKKGLQKLGESPEGIIIQ